MFFHSAAVSSYFFSKKSWSPNLPRSIQQLVSIVSSKNVSLSSKTSALGALWSLVRNQDVARLMLISGISLELIECLDAQSESFFEIANQVIIMLYFLCQWTYLQAPACTQQQICKLFAFLQSQKDVGLLDKTIHILAYLVESHVANKEYFLDIVDVDTLSCLTDKENLSQTSMDYLQSWTNIFITYQTQKNNLSIIFANQIASTKTLGEGGFSKVYSCYCKNNTALAIKVPDQLTFDFLEELVIHSKLNHQNIIRCLGIYDDMKGRFGLALELAEGLLSDYIDTWYLSRSSSPSVSWSLRIKVATDIVSGLIYLHENHIIHYDIKSSNILIKDGCAKIADFGLASHNRHVPERGTINYMAPEMLFNKQQYMQAADMFSFAMLLLELCTLKKPWGNECRAKTPEEEFVFIKEELDKHKRPRIPSGAPSEVVNVISSCWQSAPKLRYDAQSAYNSLISFKS